MRHARTARAGMVTPPLPVYFKHSNLQKCAQNSTSTSQKTQGKKQKQKKQNKRTGIIFHSPNSKSYIWFKSVADLEKLQCQASDHNTKLLDDKYWGEQRKARLPLGLRAIETETLSQGSILGPLPFEPHKLFHPTQCICVHMCTHAHTTFSLVGNISLSMLGMLVMRAVY